MVEPIRPGRVILLNGVGSAGKSSIARALQSILETPYLHVQMDAFLDMLPARYEDHPEGFSYEVLGEGHHPLVTVRTGAVGEKTLCGMRHAVVAMARVGNNLIVDDVLIGQEKEQYEALLRGFDFLRVGIFASLEVLEQRERDRGDRRLGLARWQFDKVHMGMTYDLQIDTSEASPQASAALIKAKLRL